MGNKSIKCPFCGDMGTLGVEYRKDQKKSKSNWDHLLELREKNPNLPDWELIHKIPHPGKLSIRNIPTKKYERKRNPIFKVYHTSKVTGKPKTYSHYLGTNPINKIEKNLEENPELKSKINLVYIKKLILDMSGEIKISEDPKLNELIANVINLKKHLYFRNEGFRKSLKEKHACPYCEEKISIKWYYEGLKLNKSISKKKNYDSNS